MLVSALVANPVGLAFALSPFLNASYANRVYRSFFTKNVCLLRLQRRSTKMVDETWTVNLRLIQH